MPRDKEECLPYHIAEYNQLRQELVQNVKDSYSSVTYSVFANALLVAWIASHVGQQERIDGLIKVAACLPVLVSLVAWILYRLRRRSIQNVYDYCAMLEDEYALERLGWDRFHRIKRENVRFYIRSHWVLNIVCAIQLILSGYFLRFFLVNF
jgi:hypothetical protein